MRGGLRRSTGDLTLKSANPFVTIIYAKMTFLALKKYAETNYKIIQYHKSMGLTLENIDPTSESSSSSSSESGFQEKMSHDSRGSNEFEEISPRNPESESGNRELTKEELEKRQDRNSVLMEALNFGSMRKETLGQKMTTMSKMNK